MEKLRNNCRAKEIHKNDNVGYKSTKKSSLESYSSWIPLYLPTRNETVSGFFKVFWRSVNMGRPYLDKNHSYYTFINIWARNKP